eukprot:TRINITY_DN12438_c2_g3_i3.p1 TRINITY_DN12438_c2_g3~~TRINITY_DN12438_c2_g3_i3.p1  ORF type:complete len:305 (+),score=27.80 TRINITY_DN12438_c2_g3_i3:57-971(+)
MAVSTARMKFIDIGANLTDPVFMGVYRGKTKHAGDLQAVLERAWKQGMESMIITGTSLLDSQTAFHLAETEERLYCTVGCHPTRCDEFESNNEPSSYLKGLKSLLQSHPRKVVAVGETGLDYARLEFCAKDTQLTYFRRQIDLALELNKPMFLHLRDAHQDFIDVMRSLDRIPSGVVHSYDGPLDAALELIELGFYIGLNGCSLRTDDNLAVVRELPLERLMLETDCPWCDIRPTHAGAGHVKTTFDAVKKPDKYVEGKLVKGRNEPCSIIQVAEVIAGVKEVSVDVIASAAYANTRTLFFPTD